MGFIRKALLVGTVGASELVFQDAQGHRTASADELRLRDQARIASAHREQLRAQARVAADPEASYAPPLTSEPWWRH